MVLRVLGAFFLRGFREALSYRLAFVVRGFVAGISLLALFYFARFIDTGEPLSMRRYGADYLGYGLVGIVFLNLQHTAVSAYSRIIRVSQLAGTLEAMLATPTPAWMVLLFAPVYRFVTAFVAAAGVLALGSLAFGLDYAQANMATLAVTVPLCMAAFMAVGCLGAALTMILRRPEPLSALLGGLSALAGGVFFPREVLPSWLAAAGELLPLTHALELVRLATFKGASLARLGAPLSSMVVFTCVMVPVGIATFAAAVRRARKDGSLTHY